MLFQGQRYRSSQSLEIFLTLSLVLADTRIMSSDLNELFKGDETFWAKYVNGRPNIPSSYFNTIFDYHKKHGGSFNVAHDVGAGSGVHTARLIDRFQHVILSDPYKENVNVAESQLATAAADGRCTFQISTLENTINTVPAQSVDLVFGQAMFHYTEHDQAMAAVVHQLRPGGTVAMSMVGIPVFRDPRVWQLWTRICQSLIGEFIHEKGGAYGPARPILLGQLANLDSMPLSEEDFLPGAQRIKLRSQIGEGRYFLRESSLREEFQNDFPPWSEIGTSDVISDVDER